ncbi:MAG: class I SAM-dependent methyltransferase [Bifidobacteriaceae bacterium]|nr:class I SAM-dependent methyltransferase [Bifidobacteriaceae bacterium]
MTDQLELLSETVQESIGNVVARARLHDMYSGDGARLYHATSENDKAELANLLSTFLPEIKRRGVNMHVVDLCAGSGRITEELSSLGIARITAVDTSRELLKILDAKALPNVASVRSDAIEWLSQQPTNSLDFITIAAGSIRLFDHDQRLALFSQLRRTLNEDGLLWFSHEYVSQPHAIFLPCEMNVDGARLPAIFVSCPARREGEEGAVNGYWVAQEQDSSADLYLSWVRQINKEELESELVCAGFSTVEDDVRISPRRMAGGRTMMYFSAK